jgi:hypothetical protein
VLLASLDEDKAAGRKPAPATIDDGFAAAGHDVQPLVGTAMTVVGAAFCIPRREHHLRCLRRPVATHHAKAFAESKPLVFHEPIVQRAVPREGRPAVCSCLLLYFFGVAGSDPDWVPVLPAP